MNIVLRQAVSPLLLLGIVNFAANAQEVSTEHANPRAAAALYIKMKDAPQQQVVLNSRSLRPGRANSDRQEPRTNKGTGKPRIRGVSQTYHRWLVGTPRAGYDARSLSSFATSASPPPPSPPSARGPGTLALRLVPEAHEKRKRHVHLPLRFPYAVVLPQRAHHFTRHVGVPDANLQRIVVEQSRSGPQERAVGDSGKRLADGDTIHSSLFT